jgi:hypothetical protein
MNGKDSIKMRYNVDNVHSFLDFIIVMLRHYKVNLNSWIGFDLFLLILSVVFKKNIYGILTIKYVSG